MSSGEIIAIIRRCRSYPWRRSANAQATEKPAKPRRHKPTREGSIFAVFSARLLALGSLRPSFPRLLKILKSAFNNY
jgi:hypothetical protein